MTPDTPARTVLALTRIALGWIFLWTFLDKAFGLGFSTPSERAWINGGSPTAGYLSGVDGPFGGLFQSLSGAAWADWLFMIGQLGLGLALILGIGLRVAALTGVPLLLLLWASSLPQENNPFMDEHLIYALLLVGLALGGAGDHLSLSGLWRRTPIVRRAPILA
ncbi:DoxX family membrane protein [Jiangella alkaliphila]|uniref:Thiosulfate dehydrogenase [quinone] large subunit n=1 Tax=Jiangella alkaliphila TaxID=419479 RepID=A0A1H2INI6_9ACTN|nr:DoxX family membrane protein [Jiangella alkaliphila]SDU45717.1 thiosulfate dehydrogenase [quinone] large subunit [Jiangella alkaliphila]